MILDLAVEVARAAGLEVRVFGGWAEELHGLCEPREHRDVDLLCLADDASAVDAFVRGRDEVVAKRFPHKRAFVLEGVLVELFLVTRDADGYVTPFPQREYRWPDDTFDEPLRASRASVVAYRRDHERLVAAA